MEKLISAEKIKKDILDLADTANFNPHDLHFSTNDFIMNIDCAARVEAIPVKWIIYTGLKNASPDERKTIMKLINEFEQEYRRD